MRFAYHLHWLRAALLARLKPAEQSAVSWVALETIALTGLMLALSRWIDPADPLAQQAQFPWPWFAPLLLALRYGVTAGLGSTCMILAWWWLGGQGDAAAFGPFPKLYFLGGLIATMLAGEFAGNWNIQLRRVQETNAYLYERLRRVSNQYYLMRLSHDRLEHEFLLKPTTMRDALASLKTLIDTRRMGQQAATTGWIAEADAESFLRLLAQFCGVEEAGLYALPNGRNEAIAYVGSLPGPDAKPVRPNMNQDDPMVAHALENHLLTHLSMDGIGRRQPSEYQLVAPLLTADDRILGLITVKRIGFFALHEETLVMLAALVGYLADSLATPESTRKLREGTPDCPAEFAEELGRLLHLANAGKVESWLVLQVFHNTERGADTIEGIRRMRRGLDGVWLLTGESYHAVLTLLPMTNDAGVDGYIERIGKWADDLYGQNFSMQHRTIHTEPLLGVDPASLVRKALAPLGDRT
ncbi:pellicle/biofilm biosynthesis protein PelD [Chitinimonas prasina]|uniref:Pellicle/biofilm biosynthesis protein PelD n=1 Tax=Chitinimonas prasina TaxID=1434937 RepID=A0ABQ5YFJ9_9NEIS|nr:PelD GGDEF domain-containing protein [Chitinimonas prasina]GLR13776.1 pellicle/biofilm biosynthesis protein PelD [Chitinimonas prasina]